jgi:hypothetical protein
MDEQAEIVLPQKLLSLTARPSFSASFANTRDPFSLSQAYRAEFAPSIENFSLFCSFQSGKRRLEGCFCISPQIL